MNCKKLDKYLSKSLDDRLKPSESVELKNHLDGCSACRKKQMEYLSMRKILKQESSPEMKPYFWERLQPKLKKQAELEPWTVAQKLGLRAIPLSLIFLALFAAVSYLLVPATEEQISLSQTGTFLLQNTNPLGETQPLLSEDLDANKHIMLLFSSIEETTNGRR